MAAVDEIDLVQEAHGRVAPVVKWLLDDGRHRSTRSTRFIDDLCRRLIKIGLGLDRVTLHIRQLHPQFPSRTILWTTEAGGAVEVSREYGVQNTPMFLRSPVKPIYEGAPAIRRRIQDPTCPVDFPILIDLKAQGYTDYTIRPLYYSGRQPMGVGYATKGRSGFSDLDIAMLDAVAPALGTVFELRELHRTARLLLETYIGRNSGERILSGAIRRGHGEVIKAVLWYSDLRGFTELSQALALDEVIALLNDYFDQVAGPVTRHNGEILKFIGDAMLAIFPSEPAIDRACAQALAAAEEALAGIADLNRLRAGAGLSEVRCGMALHVGKVMYGNIGAADRLDFTVIGPAVNLVTRLEPLTRDLTPPLIVSANFARLSGRTCHPIGHFTLKGITEPQEAFTLGPDGFSCGPTA